MTQATTSSLPSLASPERLSVWLGVPADDAKLVEALAMASARFRGAVRHPVTHVEADEVALDGSGATTMQLPAVPVTEVGEVRVNGEPVDDFEWSANGTLYRQAGWPRRLRAVWVAYDHGYQVVPDDIAEVVVDQARAMYTAVPGLSSVQTSVEQVTFGPQAAVGVTAQWSDCVQRHRINRGDHA